MNKKELVLDVCDRVDMSESEVEAVIDEVFASIEKELVKGNQVKLLGFGVFYKKDRAPRVGTNPSTHENIEIPGSATVCFRPSKFLKESVNK